MENIHERIHAKIKVNNENQSSPTKKENTFEAKITTLNGAEEMEEEKNQKRKHIQIFKNENKIYPTFESKVAKPTIRQALTMAENQVNKVSKNHGKIYPTAIDPGIRQNELNFKNCRRKLATFKNGASYTYIPKNLREIINTNCTLKQQFLGNSSLCNSSTIEIL